MNEIFKKILDNLDEYILLIDKNYSIIYANKKTLDKFKFSIDENKKCYNIIFNTQIPCSGCPIFYLSEINPVIEQCVSLTEKEFLKVDYIFFSLDKILISMRFLEKEKPCRSIILNVLENLSGIVFFIQKGKIIYVNKFAEKSLGFNTQELIGLNFIETLIPEREKIKVEEYFRKFFKGVKDEETIIFSLKTRYGKEKIFSWDFFEMFDWKLEKVLVIVGIDVTEFVKIRDNLEIFHKTQTFSEFLRGLVHDYNNILQGIQNYLNVMKKNIHNPTKIQEYINLTERTLSSWIDLNRLLLEYTKEIKEVTKKRIEMVGFLKENLELFQFIAGKNIKIYIDFDYLSAVWIHGDSSFWRYIFLNFISNAKDAIEGEGEIWITLKTEKKDGNYLIITIKDTGCGIPEENINKIFKPFFTTKPKGSGLGLFLIKNHIQNLNGKIEVESKVGKGTTFKLYIPIIKEKKIFDIAKAKEKRKLNIVVVDDSQEIREFLKEILEKEGHKVYSFKSGGEVLKNIDKIDKIDLLIVDINLPDIKGDALYNMLKYKFPELKVLYLTGDILALADFSEENVLLKPFKIEELFTKIEELF